MRMILVYAGLGLQFAALIIAIVALYLQQRKKR
jgi:hypothetical protein